MPPPVVDRSEAIADVFRRAETCRITPTELARQAGVHVVTMSRIKTRGTIDLDTLDKLEKKLAEIEAERAAA